jgi:hypothetical protein
VTVHIRLRSSPVFGEVMLGGEVQRGNSNIFSGYSETAQRIGKPSYLEPNSQSNAEKIGDRVAIGEKHNQNHVEKALRTYLDRIRNRMQKPVEGLSGKSTQTICTINKGATDCPELNSGRSLHRNKQQQKSAHDNTKHRKRPNLRNS